MGLPCSICPGQPPLTQSHLTPTYALDFPCSCLLRSLVAVKEQIVQQQNCLIEPLCWVRTRGGGGGETYSGPFTVCIRLLGTREGKQLAPGHTASQQHSRPRTQASWNHTAQCSEPKACVSAIPNFLFPLILFPSSLTFQSSANSLAQY